MLRNLSAPKFFPDVISKPKGRRFQRLPLHVKEVAAFILSLRLHRILLRVAAAILQRIASAKVDVQAILCNRAAPHMQPLCRLHRSTRGSGGSVTFCLNIHLPLLPLANSPLGSRGTRMPTALCARGSMTLRRAKAAIMSLGRIDRSRIDTKSREKCFQYEYSQVFDSLRQTFPASAFYSASARRSSVRMMTSRRETCIWVIPSRCPAWVWVSPTRWRSRIS